MSRQDEVRLWFTSVRWHFVVELTVLIGLVVAHAMYFRVEKLTTLIDPWYESFGDFIAHFWRTGRHPAQPSDGFYYSVFAGLVFVPLAQFEARTANLLWCAAQLLCFAGIFLLGRSWIRGAALPVKLFHVVALGSTVAMLHNFKWGQISALVTVLILGALVAMDRRSSRTAALILAVAVAIKGYPALAAVPLALRRRWSTIVFGLVGFAFFAALLPAVALGPSRALAAQRTAMMGARAALDGWVMSTHNAQYALSVLARWIDSPRQNWSPSTLSMMVTLAVAAFAFVVSRLAILLRFSGTKGGAWSAALMLPSIPLLVPTSWTHYFIFLPAAQSFLVAQVGRSELPYCVRLVLYGALSISAGLMTSVVCVKVQWERYVGAGLPFVASMLTLAVALVLAQVRCIRMTSPR